MNYSLKWLFGLMLAVAIALGLWRLLQDSYDAGAKAERMQIVDEVVRQRERFDNFVKWENWNNQDHEERIRDLESQWPVTLQHEGIIINHEKRIAEQEGRAAP